MARRIPRPTQTLELTIDRKRCGACRHALRTDYRSRRVVTTLDGVIRLRVPVRRCHDPTCSEYLRPVRPTSEARIALPHHEFGFDVIALVGTLRYAHHQSVPEIQAALTARGITIATRTVTNLLDRYDELLALRLTDGARLRKVAARHGRAVFAIDGLQPDVGHEVLWVVRDCVSRECLRARSLLSSYTSDLARLLREAKKPLKVPITGVVSDGQNSIRTAVALALPGVPHQLCHFHYLREAARPVFEADRHAKKLLKVKVRGVRPIEREVESRHDNTAVAIRGYCAAVRTALTDDGRPPLAASGLKLQERLSAISASLRRVDKKRGFRLNCSVCAL